MPEPTRLYRSHSYPYQNISEDVELQKYIDTDSGMFLLTVLNEEGDFELQIPTDQEGKYDSIFDTFDGFQDRETLYKALAHGEGVYKFIQDTMEEFQTLNVKEKSVGTDIVVTMNNDRFVLTVEQSTGICKMKYPERETEFYIDNIYIENPELPLIKEGRLVQYLTEKVKKELGMDLPKAPYLPMLKIDSK